ncbi:MAG: YbbR-like domain-containing protein [Acutalibacteraceae bacterium]
MKSKSRPTLTDFLYNDKIVFILSFVVAFVIWLLVVINVSPTITNVVKDVEVTIDNTVPSQFGLEVFGDSEFTVDVTVKGKKYVISSSSLIADDIIVTAQTNSVDSAGNRTLQLKAESKSGRTDYTITGLSAKTIDVYFDTAKTVQMVIESDVVTDGFPVVSEGFECGDINLSSTSVTITGPSTEVNSIEKVVARLVLDESLSSNKSADAELIPLNANGKSNFKYLTLSENKVVLTIPVLRVKELQTSVIFKNAPDNFIVTPLKYTVSPERDLFKVSVDEYDRVTSFDIGTIDFKNLSPSNHVFTFSSEDLAIAEDSSTEEYKVNVNVSGISQEYFTINKADISVNNPKKTDYAISGLNKSVAVCGKTQSLSSITEKDIKVEVDLSEVNISVGQTVSVPAVVSVSNADCWVYGTYTVDVSL